MLLFVGWVVDVSNQVILLFKHIPRSNCRIVFSSSIKSSGRAKSSECQARATQIQWWGTAAAPLPYKTRNCVDIVQILCIPRELCILHIRKWGRIVYPRELCISNVYVVTEIHLF